MKNETPESKPRSLKEAYYRSISKDQNGLASLWTPAEIKELRAEAESAMLSKAIEKLEAQKRNVVGSDRRAELSLAIAALKSLQK